MSNEMPRRGRITDALVAYLRAHEDIVAFPLLVGDGEAPPEAGWEGGQPGKGVFHSSSTVRTGPALPAYRDTVRARHTSWTMQYRIKTVGAARQQADAAADTVRAAVLGFATTTIEHPGDSHDWKIAEVRYDALGALERTPGVDQATWEVDDVVLVVAVRETT